MKANPGGYIAPENVKGRDALIERIWNQLESQCVLLNAERRIGKTSIIRKMAEEAPDGWFGVFQDLESVHSAEEFALRVYSDVQKFLSRTKKLLNAAQKIYEEHEFGGFKKTGSRPWKQLLTSTIEDLMASKTEERLVMFWDEMPYMIGNIRDAEGPQAAVEVLDTLRSLRQKHKELRMVFTGSIGLHHVIAQLQKDKRPTEPVNDMFAIEVPPFDKANAQALAKSLIKGEKLATTDLEVAAQTIADETDGFPFYIHHIVQGLKNEKSPANSEEVCNLIGQHLVDANDPWDLGHYRERIDIYYREPSDAKLVRLILDALAVSGGPTSLNELIDLLNAQSDQYDDRSYLIKILRLMEQDHYLRRNESGHYEFRFPIVRRWWLLDRGITE